MKTKTTSKRITLGLAGALAALAAVPASGMAATSFGAHLTKDIQPSNATTQGAPCVNGNPQQCTRVEMDAYNNAGGERATKSGTLKKVKLIARGPGHFRLQIAKAKPGSEKAKIVAQGPTINYDGQGPNADMNSNYKVESFDVDVPIHKGEYLAIKAKRTSMLRCSSGGPNQLLFQPALSLNDPFEKATGTDGCWLLLEGVIK